jgi:hypothetical protein
LKETRLERAMFLRFAWPGWLKMMNEPSSQMNQTWFWTQSHGPVDHPEGVP